MPAPRDAEQPRPVSRPVHEVCVYTDSAKVMVRSLGEIYDQRAVRSYWDGEATGR